MKNGFDQSGREQGQEPLENQLDALFAAYREACPEPEASADFMPRLWARIEGRTQTRTQVAFAWRRWAQAFISLAAAACLLIAVVQVLPSSSTAYFHSTYIDQLSEDDGPEQMLLQEVASADARPPVPASAPSDAVSKGTNGR